jgi:hypothetical protein
LFKHWGLGRLYGRRGILATKGSRYKLWADWKLPVGARGHAEWPDLERAGPGARGRYSARVRLNLEFSAMAAHGSWTETTGRSPFASTAITWSLAAELSTGRYWDR